MRARENGFTLLELLIVLAILGIVIGVIAGHGPPRTGTLQTRAAAGTFARTLRAARAAALARGAPVNVVIDPGRRSFAIDGGAIETLAPGVPLAILPPTLPGPGEARIIRFAPDGSASGGGAAIGAGPRRLDVRVEWMTGAVKVSHAS